MMLKQKTTEVDPVLGKPKISFMDRVKLRVSEPTNQIMGMDARSTSKLLYGAEQAALERVEDHERQACLQQEAKKREAFERIVSLANASQAESKKLAVLYARQEFERFPGDSGSPEVQAAISTIKIHYLAQHLKENRKNFPSMRKLEMMVQGRQRILKYLKRSNPERYFWAIEKLGLTDDVVTQEFHLSRKYFYKTQFFGDKTLPIKLNKKERAEKHRMEKLKKRAKRFMRT